MKQIFSFLLAALLALPMAAQDGKSFYEKYSDADGVDAVHVSGFMLHLVDRLMPAEDEDDLKLKQFMKTFSGVYVLNSENARVSANIMKDVEKAVKRSNCEELLEAKEDGEVTHIYTMGDEDTVRSLFILTQDDDEVTLVSIDGKIPREELEKAIAESQKD